MRLAVLGFLFLEPCFVAVVATQKCVVSFMLFELCLVELSLSWDRAGFFVLAVRPVLGGAKLLRIHLDVAVFNRAREHSLLG